MKMEPLQELMAYAQDQHGLQDIQDYSEKPC